MAGESSDLLIFLPSSVTSADGQDNTISHYTTRLAAPITLAPGVDYEAALMKLIYPTSAQNCYNGELEFWSYTFKRRYVTSVVQGFYQTPRDLLRALNRVFDADKQYYTFSFDRISQKFRVESKRPRSSNADLAPEPYIKLSENLEVLTGLPRVVFGTGFTVSDKFYDMSGGIQNIYCYCDLVQKSNIGNTLAPVMAVLSYKSSNQGAQVDYEPKNPIYIPFSTLQFQTITVELRTKIGQYVPFTAGESLAVIHVKQKSPSL